MHRDALTLAEHSPAQLAPLPDAWLFDSQTRREGHSASPCPPIATLEMAIAETWPHPSRSAQSQAVFFNLIFFFRHNTLAGIAIANRKAASRDGHPFTVPRPIGRPAWTRAPSRADFHNVCIPLGSAASAASSPMKQVLAVKALALLGGVLGSAISCLSSQASYNKR